MTTTNVDLLFLVSGGRCATRIICIPSCPAFAAGGFSRSRLLRALRAAGTDPPRPSLSRCNGRSLRASIRDRCVYIRLYSLEDFLVVPRRKKVGHRVRPFERQAASRELVHGIAHERGLRQELTAMPSNRNPKHAPRSTTSCSSPATRPSSPPCASTAPRRGARRSRGC